MPLAGQPRPPPRLLPDPRGRPFWRRASKDRTRRASPSEGHRSAPVDRSGQRPGPTHRQAGSRVRRLRVLARGSRGRPSCGSAERCCDPQPALQLRPGLSLSAHCPGSSPSSRAPLSRPLAPRPTRFRRSQSQSHRIDWCSYSQIADEPTACRSCIHCREGEQATLGAKPLITQRALEADHPRAPTADSGRSSRGRFDSAGRSERAAMSPGWPVLRDGWCRSPPLRPAPLREGT
jgi:hypothetical protein